MLDPRLIIIRFQQKCRIFYFFCFFLLVNNQFVYFRSYVTFDILRRILADYFGYEISYVMNITDIDDKIIKRARQNYLYQQYLEKNHDLSTTLLHAKNVLADVSAKVKVTQDDDKRAMLDRMVGKITAAVDSLEKVVEANDAENTLKYQKVTLHSSLSF